MGGLDLELLVACVFPGREHVAGAGQAEAPKTKKTWPADALLADARSSQAGRARRADRLCSFSYRVSFVHLAQDI